MRPHIDPPNADPGTSTMVPIAMTLEEAWDIRPSARLIDTEWSFVTWAGPTRIGWVVGASRGRGDSAIVPIDKIWTTNPAIVTRW